MIKNEMAIDLGTSYTLVYIIGKGVVLREPTIVALDRKKDEIVAIGKEAEKMVGKTPDNIAIIYPLRDGVISDYVVTEKFLRIILRKVAKKSFLPPKVMVCIPSQVTKVEKKALVDVVAHSGAREVYLIEEPKAAALGAGVDITKPKGNMVIDIGGGTTDIAVISLGDVVSSKSIRIGGNTFDKAIRRYIKKRYELLIGEKEAEIIKKSIGTLILREDDNILLVSGRDLKSGMPKDITITSNELIYPLDDIMRQIVYVVEDLIEETEPSLVSDIAKGSIYLTGGGSLIHGMAKYFSDFLGMNVVLAKNAESAVAIGTGIALGKKEKFDSYKEEYITEDN